MNETTDEHRAAKPQPQNISPRLCGEIRFGCGYAAPGSSVLLTRKSFAGRKGFFFAKSSRSSRLRGESWAGLSPRRREAREENAKDFSLVAALLLCENGLSWHGRPRPCKVGSNLRARQEIRCTFCCWPPGPLARRERRAYPLRPLRYVRSEQHSQRACGPQPGGARRRAGICGVAAPRRCHHIACVAAPCICPPGARAKMHTLFPDGPLPRVGHPRQFLPTVVDFFNGTHNVVHIVMPPQQQPVLQPHRFAAGALRVGTEVRKGCVIDLARVVVTGGRTAARIEILI